MIIEKQSLTRRQSMCRIAAFHDRTKSPSKDRAQAYHNIQLFVYQTMIAATQIEIFFDGIIERGKVLKSRRTTVQCGWQRLTDALDRAEQQNEHCVHIKHRFHQTK